MSGFGAVWAEINLHSLANNLNIVKKHLDAKTKILAVVKADAYGHGLCEIARKLACEGVGYFGVASVDDGIKLVKSGINLPVLVLSSCLPKEMPVLLEAGLIPSVNCIYLAKEANLYGRSKNIKIKLHIKIDTGTGGDGFPYNECSCFFDMLSDMEWVTAEGIYTHLSSAYGQDDEKVRKQLTNFRYAIDIAGEKGINIPLVHAASSPAIFAYPEAHFNMVRAGTVLYGIPFIKDASVHLLKPVMQLKSRIVCIKEFKDGCSPGYGMVYNGPKNIRIAVVSVGYADAPFLLNAKGLKVLINGKFAPVYGKAYMNHINVDISEFDNLLTGDEVVILGTQKNENIGLLDVANACGISKVNCESICFTGNGVVRVYTGNDEAAVT